MEVGIKAAKTDLSRLVKAALAGQKVVITDRGKALVRLVPEVAKKKPSRRGFGSLKGVLKLPPGWDSPQAKAEVTALFEGLE